MAKLARESRLRERRQEKQAKKEARKLASAHDRERPEEPPFAINDESVRTDAGQHPDDAATRRLADPSDA